MAQLNPATPFPGSSPDLIRLFYLFKRLPDDITVTQRLPHGEQPAPDFWLAWGKRVLFLSVSPATAQDLSRVQQPDLFGQSAVSIGLAEDGALTAFVHQLKLETHLTTAVLFPHLAARQIQPLRPDSARAAWVGKEQLTPERLPDWLADQLSSPLTAGQMDHIRQHFSPEVIIPAAFTVRQPVARNTEAGLAHYLLDYDQEQALKLDLNLPKSGHDTAQDFQLRLVNGVAGSGKSLIIIYRAFMLRRLFPHKRILVLTHNRALIQDLRRRYARLSGGDQGVEMQTFMGWCRRQWPADKPPSTIIRFRERLELVTQIWYEQLRHTTDRKSVV